MEVRPAINNRKNPGNAGIFCFKPIRDFDPAADYFPGTAPWRMSIKGYL
jgi:hypothetical protein